jgi:hypothetical protein
MWRWRWSHYLFGVVERGKLFKVTVTLFFFLSVWIGLLRHPDKLVHRGPKYFNTPRSGQKGQTRGPVLLREAEEGGGAMSLNSVMVMVIVGGTEVLRALQGRTIVNKSEAPPLEGKFLICLQ